MIFLNKKPQIFKNIEKDLKFKKSNKIKSDCNTKSITTNNNNNNNNNINNNNNNNNKFIKEDDNPWDIYTTIMIEEGFLKSCILDLNDGEVNSGFNVVYQEWQEIINILEGKNSIYLNCGSTRFFISNSNDLMISGRDSTSLSFILRRTANKCIIGIFQTTTVPIDSAHKITSDIYNKIINFDKNERVSNLIFSFSEDSLKNIVN
ncbi:hypothetical protein RB653_006297 [Dictyostelium firmibasis]|uniref:Profilin n=1 Tax=Dictyostelium firmibasis TaxID=79012 RepID=A0AAN7UB12_9MYCE